MRGLVDTLRADGFRAEARVLDVVDRAATQVMVDEVAEEHGGIDVFVANAGLMLLSPVESMLVDEWERMVDVNLKGLLHGVGAVLPHFLAQGTGHFVTVASIGAHSVVPTSAVYSATKYAAWAFTEGLRQELDPAIRVTTVSPGVVESELATHITDTATQDAMRTYRKHAIPADAVAQAISYAIDQPRDVDVNEVVLRPSAQRP